MTSPFRPDKGRAADYLTRAAALQASGGHPWLVIGLMAQAELFLMEGSTEVAEKVRQARHVAEAGGSPDVGSLASSISG